MKQPESHLHIDVTAPTQDTKTQWIFGTASSTTSQKAKMQRVFSVIYNQLMNYETAKALKDAGFPMPDTSWDNFDQEILKTEWDMYRSKFCPTLEELIEACGERFGSLNNWLDGWGAFGIKKAFGEGATPTEAVARLWLALHTKDD